MSKAYYTISNTAGLVLYEVLGGDEALIGFNNDAPDYYIIHYDYDARPYVRIEGQDYYLDQFIREDITRE